MKRYSVKTWNGHADEGSGPYMAERPDGEWVRYADVFARPAGVGLPEAATTLANAAAVAALGADPPRACHCQTCYPTTVSQALPQCPECGRSMCPHAIDHRSECTGIDPIFDPSYVPLNLPGLSARVARLQHTLLALADATAEWRGCAGTAYADATWRAKVRAAVAILRGR